MKKAFSFFILTLVALCFCAAQEYAKSVKQETVMNTFKSVTMNEGLELMKKDSNFILLDVRTLEEYKAGHIPSAVQLTNETFTKQDAEKLLKDKNQTIYCYCRSGRRSKQSSQKLVNFGYTNVIEIGGIISYSGPIE